jgi:hypothetical protein
MKVVHPAYKFVDYMGNRIPVPTHTRFIAMDAGHHIHAFPYKPVYGGLAWVCDGNEYTLLGKVETDLLPEQTLVEIK